MVSRSFAALSRRDAGHASSEALCRLRSHRSTALRRHGHIAEQCDSCGASRRYLLFGTQHQDVRLYAYFLQLLHRMLGGLGLKLLGRGDIGYVCKVDRTGCSVPAPIAAGVRFRNGSDSMSPTVPPILRDYKIIVACIAQVFDATFDLIGDVGYDLHGLAQIVAAAFLVDYALVDSAGGNIVWRGKCAHW